MLFLGFIIFATFATHKSQHITAQADGIVVLTGGSERIATAARLLHEKRAKWLLISGVNKKTSKADILRLSKLDPELFACCVTLGYVAQDTKGNALEARDWQRGNHFKSLIIVTAAYHMPRSLVELSRQMPHVKLIPYSVMPKRFRTDLWWLQSANVKLLVNEYIKFIPSAAQLVLSRIFDLSAHQHNKNDNNPIQIHHAGVHS